MADPIEDLLAQMRAQYGDDEQPVVPPAASPARSPSPSPAPVPLPAAPSDAIDSLLNELAETVKPAAQTSSAAVPPLSSPVQLGKTECFEPSDLFTSQAAVPSLAPIPADDPLLATLKAEYAEQERQETLKRQEQERIEQQQREKRKRQQRIAAMKPAEEWLKKLDPRSGEAAWFEEFAAKYTSRIEAAIDYLGLVQEE